MARLVRGSGLAIVLGSAFVGVSIGTAYAQEEVGRDLFERHWVSHDSLSPQGDGLGPMHNATSCADCHHLGGTGGAGSIERNIDLLSVVPPDEELSQIGRRRFQEKLTALHAGFTHGARSTVLHRFGPEGDYPEWRLELLGIKPLELLAARSTRQRALDLVSTTRRPRRSKPVEELPRINGIRLQLSHRNTPSLFGAGWIDRIPVETLEASAREQALRFPGLSGRLPRTSDGSPGRFGWRGQTASLRDFVLNACATELGLEVEGKPQPANPRAVHYHAPGADLDELQSHDMFLFVYSLPRPVQIIPNDAQAAAIINNGEQLFETIGCGACHVKDLGDVDGLYSDLLLHDMGEALADPVPAMPELAGTGQQTTFFAGYLGVLVNVFDDVATPTFQEWRTPPLWGVRDSAPYLHDGRAETLHEAISQHGGQGAHSARRFIELPSAERARIIAFLNSLVAP